MDKRIKELIFTNTALLNASEKNFKSLYDIVFSNNAVLAETNDGFRTHQHTFADVRKEIEHISAGIYEKIGSSGCYIGLDMDNCVEWIVSFWAILRSGNKPFLVNSRHPLHLSNSILKTLDIKYVISLTESRLSAQTLVFSELKSNTRFDGAFEDEMALSTSATSLKETICFYSGQEISNQVLNVLDFIRSYPEIARTYNGRIKQLAFLPFYHIFGFIAVYFWFTFFGQTVVFLPDISANTILKTCRNHKVTHIFAVPLFWHTIEKEINKKLASDDKKAKKFQKGISLCTSIQNLFPELGMRLSQKIMRSVTDELLGDSVRFCISGGSYIKESALKVMNGLGYSLHNGYGMSEIGITSVDLRTKPKHLNCGSIGKPFKSVEYRINRDGILEVKGSSICNRIIRDGKSIEVDGWFLTGDRMESKDGYYYIFGRDGDMVLGENGENINPDMVEQKFDLPYAKNFSVLGLGPADAQELSLVVELGKFTSAAKIKATIDSAYKCAELLSTEFAVKKFYFTKDPLMSESAIKVSRKYLKSAIDSGSVSLIPFSDIAEGSYKDNSVTSELEAAVKDILAQVLDISAQDINKDAHILFELGASSIDYFSFISLLAEHFSIDTSTEGIENCYTVNDFCILLEGLI